MQTLSTSRGTFLDADVALLSEGGAAAVLHLPFFILFLIESMQNKIEISLELKPITQMRPEGVVNPRNYTTMLGAAALTVGKDAPLRMPHSPPDSAAPFARRM